MRILHTSDWHLGHTLYGHKRYGEFEAFLNWLDKAIQEKQVDALIISGDIFDTVIPSNQAQELYYQFLGGLSKTCCKHVVVIAGNHDSPSFIDAPKSVLHAINVHVIGSMKEEENGGIKEEIISLSLDKKSGKVDAIVCAVPYLRDCDVRNLIPGESGEDKGIRLSSGIVKHYTEVYKRAEQMRANAPIPLIATGHLFTVGGKHENGDGVRDQLYVGTLVKVDPQKFPSGFDYVALGHLHIPQRVGKFEHIQYSGSPIPMGFNESDQEKKVIIVDFDGRKPVSIQKVAVPRFHSLVKISGSLDEIQKGLSQLRVEKSTAWVEVEYTGAEFVGNLREQVEGASDGASFEVLCIKCSNVKKRMVQNEIQDVDLDQLSDDDVFERCLVTAQVPEEEWKLYKEAYSEIKNGLMEKDVNSK